MVTEIKASPDSDSERMKDKKEVEQAMSYMVLLKNKSGFALATDSRLVVLSENEREIDDDFSKIFQSRDGDTIVGIIGNYGDRRKNVLIDVRNILLSEESFEKRWMKLCLYVSANELPGFLNIFLLDLEKKPISGYIIDCSQKNVSIRKIEEKHVVYAGRATYMNNSQTVLSISKDTLAELREKVREIINCSIMLEKKMEETNPHFVRTIGGSCKCVSVDNEGNITWD